MDQHKAIPQGYMTVGEIAQKMNVTVRTLQHCGREGCPAVPRKKRIHPGYADRPRFTETTLYKIPA